jgi:hypothetical protein
MITLLIEFNARDVASEQLVPMKQLEQLQPDKRQTAISHTRLRDGREHVLPAMASKNLAIAPMQVPLCALMPPA